jgi:predicted RNA binding protein YcfA (HicA-like mRNA interferase family)
MKLPRDVGARELTQKLVYFGYVVSRQSGSHIRLTTQLNGEHHITIPNHQPLKLGTLSQILTDVSIHQQIEKKDLIKQLFG